MASDVPWKGLHPISLLVNLVPRTWSTIRSTWPILLAILFGRMGPSTNRVVDLVLIAMFFVLGIGNTVVHFLTLRYRVSDGRLEMKSGLLNRQSRVIGAERIQNMEMVRNVFHRISGMVEVRIETASGTDVEGLLSALSVGEARALIDALDEARGEARPSHGDDAPAEVLFRNSVTDLAWFGATSTRLGGVAVLLGLLFEGLTIDPETPPDQLRSIFGGFAGSRGLLVIMALVTGAWVVGTASAIVRYFGFRVTRTDNALVAEQGLLTTRRAVLRLNKVQLVTVLEPVLRRLAGFASVAIETAAAREGGDGTQRAEAVVPFVAMPDVATVVGAALPLGPIDPTNQPLRPPHPRALIRGIAASAIRSALLAAGISWWLFPYGLLAWVLLPVAVVTARLDYRYQGWLVGDALVISRRGWLSRRTWLLARSKIQSTTVAQGPILRRYGLGVIQVRVAGNVVELPAMGWEEALDLQGQLLSERDRPRRVSGEPA